ncbi:glycogen debranching protein GlgX [Nonomuraea gerenzanensis]|uniref:Glycogen debranching enzyme n=1 Tax=Nonomuraea gerenzanensis TaxID=93944 RepID=A0A1M4EAG2_9ACTN|nr:glycogen debranching protein GlgX [Nonomuraea gerenzanensis]UBU17996.1 glycogen debranching protein GlgX [Nonomuraea gerenzanensis]SBO95800.1 Glycogen debranching enzyme [Nonomuraea gerenzanensis]
MTLSLEPVVGWPHEATPGRTYLMTVDLRTPADAWPYDEEELEFTCMLDARPFFAARALDDPVLVLHRFGGTYRPVRYLLSAEAVEAEPGVDEAIWLTITNGFGVPLRTLELPFTMLRDGAAGASLEVSAPAAPPPGRLLSTPAPLGAVYDGTGTNFAVFSEPAERVELCLFDADGNETRVELPEVDGFVWHGYLEGAGPGQRYGYRVHGPHDPASGLRCNPAKLLLDPYAKAIDGGVAWDAALLGYVPGDPGTLNSTDSAPYMPRSVVVNGFFDWGDDRPPRVPYARTVMYEAHVKGMTATHPEVPPRLRGTYAGLAHPAVVQHLVDLGVTAVELMPVHEFVHGRELQARGLRDYWGYNSIGFFAPHHEYSSSGSLGEQVREFKTMVRTLHEAGLEVILDVDYTHTAEANHLGPTLSFRGLDNVSYYRLLDHDRAHYADYTGNSNTLNVRSPHTLQLIMDSLRYWVLEMHVDGFRFAMAAALAREFYDVDRLSAFFDLIQQDPVISQVKLIAEPWDVGPGGYQVGNFPPLWTEWNGRYHDTVRDFWRGETVLPEFASRLTGSSDLYESSGRRPVASINFVTSHDGFTLADLVSYDRKHNEANGEDNRDGTEDNRSWNCGAEGPTDDPDVLRLRARQQRNLLATTILSQGVPLILYGDEIGRTQNGNNNAWCQDNELSWMDWIRPDDALLGFASRLVALRARHPLFRRSRFFTGRPVGGSTMPDLVWFNQEGEEMRQGDWESRGFRTVGVFLNGEGVTEPGPDGGRVVDDSFYLVFNAEAAPVPYTLPGPEYGDGWRVEIDTSQDVPSTPLPSRARLTVPSHTMLVLRSPPTA